MNKLISKTQASEEIDNFFKHIRDKNSKDVKKIKKLAMKYNIKLGDKKKLFCKKCLSPHGNSSIILKNGFMNLDCGICGFRNRWKLDKELDLKLHYKDHESGACC